MAEDLRGYGPDPELSFRIGKAQAAPSYFKLNRDEKASAELKARLIRTNTWEQLTEEDRTFLTRCIREVEHGMSPMWQEPDAWGGDWFAEDAQREELGLDDDTPVPLPGSEVRLELVGDRHNPDNASDEGLDLDDDDETKGDWVGL